MAGEWIRTSLREAGVSLIDCDHRTPPAADSGHPYVAIPQLKQGRLDLSGVRRISHEHFVDWTRKAKPQHHDVILSRRCNPGETAYVPPGLECALGQNLVLLRADGTRLFPPFLRWLVRGPDWWEQVGHFINVGAVFDSLKCADIPNFRMPLPPLAEQRAIANILGVLDDKIELNRRMNETLEGLARAIFQSWFVDFAPVRAQRDGLPPPALSPTTAALFPDSFEDSELGKIPKGWSTTNLGKEVDLFTGFPFKSEEYTDTAGAIRLVRGDNVVQGRLRWESVKCWPSHMLDGLDDYQLQKGDVVLAMDRPWIEAGLKYAWIADHDLPCLLVQRVARLRSNGVGIGTGYARLLIGSRQFTQYVLAIQTGTAVPHISGTQIKSFEFVLPSANDRRLLQHFEQAVAPFLDRFDSNNGESATLAAIRDALLPKLLSGEVRIVKGEVRRVKA